MNYEHLMKEAGMADIPGMSMLGVSKATSSAMGLLPYLVTVPLILGVGAGYAGSTLSSPSATDVDTLQREALLTRYKGESAMRQRTMLARQRLDDLDKDLQARNQASGRKPPTDRFLLA
jgi:hypothetical protein